MPAPTQTHHFPAFYDNSTGRFLTDSKHGYNCVSQENLVRTMKIAGKSDVKGVNQLSEIDREVIRIIEHQSVDIAGPIAGYKKGYQEIDGTRILVTSSPRLMSAAEGDWEFLRLSLKRLMSPHPKQYPTLVSWHCLSVRALYLGERIYGQIPFVLGPNGCGKSFLQVGITKPLMGGRSGKIWPFISGETAFNNDLIGSEFLYAEDPPVANLADRMDFANRVKQFTVAEFHQWHAKHKDGITVNPFWRVMISSNSELRNLRVIPPLEKAIRDRIHIFLCMAHAVPPPGYEHLTEVERKALAAKQLPHYLWHLLNEWKVPAELQLNPDCERFKLDAFQHPEIVALIDDMSLEIRLFRVIEETHFKYNIQPWKGTVNKLLSDLAAWSSHPEAEHFVKMHPKALGQCLADLGERFPERVQCLKRSKEGYTWVIFAESDPKS